VHHRRHLHFTSPEASTFWRFLAYFWRFYVLRQCIIKHKKFEHHPHTMGCLFQFPQFYCLVSEVARAEKFVFWSFWPIFVCFVQNLPQLRNFF